MTLDEATRQAQADLAGTQEGDLGHATPVPGTESTQTPPAPPAEAQNTDTEREPGTSESVPYSRFKEVNDGLREFRDNFGDVVEAGYDGDSVRRLVAFEQAYQADPISTVASVVDNLDLPDAQKAAVKAALGQPAQTVEQPADDGTDDEPPAWAKPLIEDHNAREQADVAAYYDNLLQKAVDEWNRLDKEEGLEGTPPRTILRHIRGAIDEGGFTTVEELGKMARDGAMEYREHALGSAVRNRGTGPLSVPGSGVGAGAPAPKFGSIKEASRAAAQAWERGELPPVTPGG